MFWWYRHQLSSKRADRRLKALRKLEACATSLELLARICTLTKLDPDRAVREEAVAQLKRREPRVIIDLLDASRQRGGDLFNAKMISTVHPDADVRYSAFLADLEWSTRHLRPQDLARALASGPRGADDVAHYIRYLEENPGGRAVPVVVMALGLLQCTEAIDLLCRVFPQDPRGDLVEQSTIATALGHLGSARAVPTLVAALEVAVARSFEDHIVAALVRLHAMDAIGPLSRHARTNPSCACAVAILAEKELTDLVDPETLELLAQMGVRDARDMFAAIEETFWREVLSRSIVRERALTAVRRAEKAPVGTAGTDANKASAFFCPHCKGEFPARKVADVYSGYCPLCMQFVQAKRARTKG